jgi:acetyltransferase
MQEHLLPSDFPDLAHFFSPRSVALIGASDDVTRYGGRSLKILRDFGYQGTIFPVNPRGGSIQGLQGYAAVEDLPSAPDHAVVIVAADRVVATLERCAAVGIPFATVLASGFAETGTDAGHAMQRAITDVARRTGIRVMGPNCNGFINFRTRFTNAVTATISGPRYPVGNVGVVAQSGGLGMVNAMWRAQDAGLGVNYTVTCGNDADLDLLDFAHFMVEDPATEVILAIAERISRGGKFFELARRAAAKGKPIILVKLGRTEAGSRAAASHTGAVTGSDAVHDAAFRQAGVIRVDDCNELYETGMLLAGGKRARGRRASGLAVSGGSVVMLTDIGAAHGIEWPAYTERTQAELATLMPSYGRVSNPADLTTAGIGENDMWRRVLAAITADPNIDILMPIVTFGPRRDIDCVIDEARRSDKPFALLWTGGCTDQPDFAPRDVVRAGVPVYRDIAPCIRAVDRAAGYAAFLRRFDAAPRARIRPEAFDPEQIRRLAAVRRGALTEQASKALLAAAGIAVTRESIAIDPEQAVEIAETLGGPVAIKVVSPDIPHKTEAKAVRLDVRGPHAVRQAFSAVMTAARKFRPDARIEGVLVAEMAPTGLEMILGVTRDPVFGPVVMAGLGGIHVEVLRDVAYRIAPLDAGVAREMLGELRAFALLTGVRGAAARDIDAVCDALVRLSWLAVELGNSLQELDVNPVMVGAAGSGAVAVDGLVVLQ